MANITKRGDNYLITVSCGYDGNGKRLRKTMTYKPPIGMTQKQAEKEVQRTAALFEQQCINGEVLDTNTRFSDFAEKWFNEYASKNLKKRTFIRYKEQMGRINETFGNKKLSDIKPYHLTQFYNSLTEKGVRADVKSVPKPILADLIEESGKTIVDLAAESGVSASVIRSCKHGRNVLGKTAEKVAEYFGKTKDELFDLAEDKGLSGKTIMNYHLLLSSIFSTAVQWQVIFSNPCERVKPPKVRRKESRYLDEVGAAAIFEALEDEPIQFAVAIKLLLYTGLRRGELCGLEWSDIDFIKDTLTVRRNTLYVPQLGIYDDTPKSESSNRVIKMSVDLSAMLRDYQKWQSEYAENMGTAWTFSNRLFTARDGTVMNPETMSEWFRDFIKRKNLQEISLHGLRHTNASLMIAAGIPIRTVSERLGHASPTTTVNTPYGHTHHSQPYSIKSKGSAH